MEKAIIKSREVMRDDALPIKPALIVRKSRKVKYAETDALNKKVFAFSRNSCIFSVNRPSSVLRRVLCKAVRINPMKKITRLLRRIRSSGICESRMPDGRNLRSAYVSAPVTRSVWN